MDSIKLPDAIARLRRAVGDRKHVDDEDFDTGEVTQSLASVRAGDVTAVCASILAGDEVCDVLHGACVKQPFGKRVAIKTGDLAHLLKLAGGIARACRRMH